MAKYGLSHPHPTHVSNLFQRGIKHGDNCIHSNSNAVKSKMEQRCSTNLHPLSVASAQSFPGLSLPFLPPYHPHWSERGEQRKKEETRGGEYLRGICQLSTIPLWCATFIISRPLTTYIIMSVITYIVLVGQKRNGMPA